MSRNDRVRVTSFVRVPPAEAFEVFTREIDLWWGRGPRYRGFPNGRLTFEEGPEGRLLEIAADGSLFVIGEVRVWAPGERLVFTWRNRNFLPDQSTEVEIRFTPKRGGTEVLLEHRGWAAIPDDHPARHGLDEVAFAANLGRWWGDLAGGLRERLAERGSGG